MNKNLINKLYKFVEITCKMYDIDESHSIKHSMDVFYYANKIYDDELKNNKGMDKYKNIIDIASILHDMCDKKYMDENEGINRIEKVIENEITKNEIDIIKNIILTMSYSTVKKNGYPNLGEYQIAYHIVREADLLTSYDFERCVIYKMMKTNENYLGSISDALEVFNNRVLRYDDDNLFVTNYSKKECKKLKEEAIIKINNYRNLIEIWK